MKIQILIILIIFLLNTGFAETITTLSDGTNTKEITIDGKYIEYLEIPNDVIITSAGMDLAGFSQKPGAETIITEIDKYKSSYHPYCKEEDSYCFGFIDDKVFWSKLIFASSKTINLTKLSTHTLHSDFGGEKYNYNLTICKSSGVNAQEAKCADSEFVLFSGIHNSLIGPSEKHPTANYDEQIMDNSYLIQAGTNYLMTWKPATLSPEYMIARKIDAIGKDIVPIWKLNIGDDSKREWGTAGIFNTTMNIIFTENLNNILKNCNCDLCVKDEKCKIPLIFNTNSERKIRISNIKIETGKLEKETAETAKDVEGTEQEPESEAQEQPGEQVKDAADETPAEVKVPAESREGSKTQILILILIFAVIAAAVIYFLKLK